MKPTYLVAWDMLTRNGARRTYTHYFKDVQEAETLYQKKMQTFSTIEIWLIKSEHITTSEGETRLHHEYIHPPKYVWR